MTAMKDILEHPRVARSTVNSGGVEHRVTTMVVGSEALARFEERAGHGWRRVDERFVKGTRRPMHVRTELRRADFPRRSQLDRYHTCKAPASDYPMQTGLHSCERPLDSEEYLQADGIPPPPSIAQ